MNKLYFDDKCPLCIKTVRIIKKYIKPRNTIVIELSRSNLEESLRNKALIDMLYIQENGKMYWGYETYRKITKTSSGNWSIPVKCLSVAMNWPVIKNLGRFLYKKISSKRNRCDQGCKIQ